MSTTSLRFRKSLFGLLAVVALAAAACSPVSKAVVTQAPPASSVPSKAAASPTPAAAVQATSAPATPAPTHAAAKAAATVQPTAAAPAATSAAQTTPSATELSQAVPVPLGEMQRDGDLEIVALKVEQMASVGSVQAQAGRHFELVTLKVTNASTGSAIKFYPEEFVLYDTANDTSFVMDPLRDLSSVPDVLSPAPIDPGASLTGVIVYEVPDANAKWELKYQTNTAHLLWSLSG